MALDLKLIAHRFNDSPSGVFEYVCQMAFDISLKTINVYLLVAQADTSGKVCSIHHLGTSECLHDILWQSIPELLRYFCIKLKYGLTSNPVHMAMLLSKKTPKRLSTQPPLGTLTE